MSTGFGGKGKDGKYNTLNLASYKGSRSAESKSSGSIYRHGGGYQSLGKVACTRRVPPPASIPSLKSENLGNDPNISLVPKDGSGWGSKTETSSVQSQESQQQPASTSFSQQTTCPTNSMNMNNRNPKWTPPTTGPQTQQHTWVSPHVQNGKKMCGVAGGAPARGTTHSSEDFPILGGFQKDGSGTNIKNKDPGYNFGTNLRPQNFSSWKSGGGKNFPHLKDENNCDEYHRNYQQRTGIEKHELNIHENKSELRSDESSWVAMHNEVDYGEKLVFSEDDEVSTKEDSISMYTIKESVYEKNTNEDISMSKPDPFQTWSPQPRLSPRLPPHRQTTSDEASLHPPHQQVTDLISNLSISSESRYSDNQNDENKIKRSEKEEAIERARKRREQEEMRMLQMKRHKNVATPDSYEASKCRKWFGGNSMTFTRQRHDSDNRLPGDGCGIPNPNNEDSSSHNYSRQYRDKSTQDLSYDRSSPNSFNTRLGLQLNNGPVISNRKLHSRGYDSADEESDPKINTSFENSKLTNSSNHNSQEMYSRSTSTDSTQIITSYTNNRSHSILQSQESNDERLASSKPTTQQPLPSRRLDKVKLRNFRVDDDDDGDSINFNLKTPSSKTDGQSSKEAGESASTEKKPWNSVQQVHEKRKQHTRSLFASKDNYQVASRYFEKDEKNESVIVNKESAAVETTDDTSASFEDQQKPLYRHNDFKRNQRDNYNSRASKRSSTANNNHKPDHETRNSSNRNSRINKSENRNSRAKPARNDARNEEPRDVRSTEPRRREPKKGFERYESKARHNHKETKIEARAFPIHKPLTRDEDSDGDIYEPVEPFPLMQTPAAPPSTNVWEERAKKQQLQQKEDLLPPTFIPTVEDKKRTLKETAPVKKSDKSRIDSSKRHPNKQIEATSRACSSPPPLQSKRRDGNYSSYDERRKGRGSRSRGTYTSNRGAGNHSNESSAPSRGRGRRGSRSSASYKTPAPSFGNKDRAQWRGRHLPDETLKDHVTDDASLSDSNDTEAGRRRQLGEISDGEVASSAISLSENEDPATVSTENQPRQMNGGKLTRSSKQSHAARGAPSRRGRGTFHRGHHSNRSRGGGTRSDVTIPPLMSSHIGKKSNFRSDHKELTSGRPSKTYGRSYPDDNEKRTAESRRKQQRPPRFDSNDHQEGGGSRRTRRHGNRVYDVSNEDWESESDRSGAEQKRHRHVLPDRVDDVTNGQRSESRRYPGGGGRGRRNGSNRRSGQQQTAFKRNMSSQVYMLHTVKYNDPSAIAGAMAGSGSNKSGELNKKSPNDIKERKKDLFQKYDLHNYARVVNVDDIPEITDQNDQLVDDLDKTCNSVQSGNINCENVSGEDDDGFTPVLSKRKQKKLQEEKKKETLLKQEKTLAILEGLRKFPNRTNRRNTNKPTTNTLSTGSSGSVRQASPSSQVVGKQQPKEVWDSKIVSWNPVKEIPPMIQVVKEKKFEKSISQHDSGVESSIPSSQRSSPGTDTKLTFNQLANPVTTTTAASVTSKPIEQTVQSSTVASIQQAPTSDLKQFHDKDSAFQSNANPKQVNTSLNDASSINRIVPIGNERGKCPVTKLPSRSVESIVSMFPSFNASKLISFMPEASDGQKDLYCPSESLEKSTEDSKPTDLKVDLTANNQPRPAAAASSISFIENQPFISISQSVLQSEFGVSKSTSEMVVDDQGVKHKTETAKDMPLSPQITGSQGATHKNAIDTSIPSPLPISNPDNPGGDGDSKPANLRQQQQPCDVSPPSNGAGDINLNISSSNDLNKKMEDARKAWEKMEPKVKSDGYYHPNSNSLTNSIGSDNNRSNIPDTTLKDNQSNEWQNTAVSKTTVSSLAENESSSWRDNPQQQTDNSTQQSAPAQEPSQNSSNPVKIGSEVPVLNGPFSNTPQAGNLPIETTNTHVVPQYGNNNYMFLLDSNQMLSSQQRVAVTPAQQPAIYQSMPSSSLGHNIHQMQQPFSHTNPSYSSTIGIQPPQTAFNSQAREFTPMMLNQTNMNNHGNMGQQTNLNSQYAVPRPHNGAPSPHTVIIPIVEQSRTLLPSSQPNAANLINQQMNRSQSASYHSHASTGSYYGQQPSSLSGPQYQQTISFPNRGMFPLKAMSPAPSHLGLEHMTIAPPSATNPLQQSQMYPGNQTATNQSIQQRIHMDTPNDYNPYTPFYPKHQHPIINKNMTSIPGSLQTNHQPYDHSIKPTNLGANYKTNNYNSYYQISKTPENVQSNPFAKFDSNQLQSKSYPSHLDWAKHSTGSQPRPSTMNVTFSRPYTTLTDTSYNSNVKSSYKSSEPPVSFHESFVPNRFDVSAWKPPKPMSRPAVTGMVGSQPSSVSILGNPPTRPLMQTPMMNSPRFHMPNYQMPSNNAAILHPQSFTFNNQHSPANSYMNHDKSRQSPGMSIPFNNNQKPVAKQQPKLNKHQQMTHKPGPPVPTLITTRTNSLAGKKPSQLPESVIKSHQANERAKLLSLVTKFPADQGTSSGEVSSWSTKVRNSEPLPARKPGMRHPGVEKLTANRRNEAGGNRARKSGRNTKKPISSPPLPIVDSDKPAVTVSGPQPVSTKKLTLADTKPKKGEVSQINIRETSAIGAITAAADSSTSNE